LRHDPTLEALHAQIDKIEGWSRRVKAVLPFGIAGLDSRLPGGGLAYGALHEVAGGGNDAVNGAAAALFAAGVAARTRGKVLWCVARPDLFAPALWQAGLKPDRVIFLEAADEKTILASFEECLRHRGLGAAIAEVARLSMTASRRLQLAAEESGTIGLALRRWRRQAEASDYGHPTAATTRWRVSAQPSTPLPAPGVGRPRWRVELVRCRAGESTTLELEACDDKGYLRLPADRSNQPGMKVANGRAWIAGTGRDGS
jgi:protein ImuA